MDRIGAALSEAVLQALGSEGCEVRVTFDTQKELKEAGERIMKTASFEIIPGVGNFMFDTKICTSSQIELINGSCIVLSLKEPPHAE